jgi:hypothetical protein
MIHLLPSYASCINCKKWCQNRNFIEAIPDTAEDSGGVIAAIRRVLVLLDTPGKSAKREAKHILKLVIAVVGAT